MAKNKLSHFDRAGNARMVGISEKRVTHRIAIAEGFIRMKKTTFALIQSGKARKGDVLGVARIAAIQGAKRTSELIPLCHPLQLSCVDVDFRLNEDEFTISIIVSAETLGRTGVEMEALTAASTGLLTIYDMCKAVDRGMSIGPIHLVEKSGGSSGHFKRPSRPTYRGV